MQNAMHRKSSTLSMLRKRKTPIMLLSEAAVLTSPMQLTMMKHATTMGKSRRATTSHSSLDSR